MNQEVFDAFIEKYDLYSFDGLIRVNLRGGHRHHAVWITDLPPLGKSVDGKFAGIPEGRSVFYVFDKKSFVVWSIDQIKSLECLQQEYLV